MVSLLTELGIQLFVIPIVCSDNTGAMALTENPINHSNMKHVELDLCFGREKVQTGQVLVNFVPASDQLAAILKPMTDKQFLPFRRKLGVMSFK